MLFERSVVCSFMSIINLKENESHETLAGSSVPLVMGLWDSIPKRGPSDIVEKLRLFLKMILANPFI